MTLEDQHRRLLAEGIEHFNSRRFWEAHESWETIWLESAEPDKTFLQGLIQLTAACHHFQRGTLRGGIRLFDGAEAKLGGFPEGHLGVGRTVALERVRLLRDRAERHVPGGKQNRLPLDEELFEGLRLTLPPDTR